MRPVPGRPRSPGASRATVLRPKRGRAIVLGSPTCPVSGRSRSRAGLAGGGRRPLSPRQPRLGCPEPDLPPAPGALRRPGATAAAPRPRARPPTPLLFRAGDPDLSAPRIRHGLPTRSFGRPRREPRSEPPERRPASSPEVEPLARRDVLRCGDAGSQLRWPARKPDWDAFPRLPARRPARPTDARHGPAPSPQPEDRPRQRR